MRTYQFKGILQNDGWLKNATVSVNDVGNITAITGNVNSEDASVIDAYALPGFQNAHSHAFQYAMAGLTESHPLNGNKSDDFWTWREAMYQLALSINPDQMQAIATMLYAEMKRHGYTNVAEFHYLHHDKNGKPFSNLAEMGSRLIAAAKTVGISITLIPIFYQKGGFGQVPNERQRRFISPSIDEYLKLYDASYEACKHYEHANIGIGIHSMRGVEPTDIIDIAKSGPRDVPFHIHVAEQLKEIEESIAYLGKRPVEWLLQNLNINERYHLVHATHLTALEIQGIAESKASVVLCPSTEGNLGDGIFPLAKFQESGGKWSIGTDSHIGINPMEELRLLDYGQRLTSHKRNTFYSKKENNSAMFALKMALANGRSAMGNSTSEFFKIGEPLNACLIDSTAPLLATSSDKNLANTIMYATDAKMHLGTISYGKKNLTKEAYDAIRQNFIATLRELKTR